MSRWTILWMVAGVLQFGFVSESSHAIKSALVYKGPGSCSEKCSLAAAKIAIQAGLMPYYVGPKALDEKSSPEKIKSLFKNVKVWIQPGGVSNDAYEAMTPQLANALRDFIRNGGGYVGFCAGAFMATKLIGSTGEEGLGIFPGSTDLFEHPPIPGTTFSLPMVDWLGKKSAIYFEGGPYLYGYENSPDQKVETVAKFVEGGLTAAARTTYGKGRVYITGLHPEAPKFWTEEDHIKDPDGGEHQYAIDMVRWARSK